MNENQVVTLASIIEGEAIYNSERGKISGVYHNRMKIGMKLQADPTIQYIIPDGPRRLLNRDLRIESPYNTYLNKGLPPGPINSPGKHSLLAALFPEENDFLFFETVSGVPSATIFPPPIPPSGPKSIIQSAVFITSKSNSFTLTVRYLSNFLSIASFFSNSSTTLPLPLILK